MKVYFVTQKDMGKNVILKPRVPESAPDYKNLCIIFNIGLFIFYWSKFRIGV